MSGSAGMRGTPMASAAKLFPWFMGALVVASVAGAALGRLHPATQVPAGVVLLQERNLLFADMPSGAVRVTDADTGNLVQLVQGQAGFLRGTLRGLASARRHAGVPQSVPFHLSRWQDGRLTLDDPGTARHVELEAFGSDNVAVFAALLK